MYDGPIIDVCVNHTWPNQLELMQYMSAGWREYLGRPNVLPNGGGLISINPGNPYRRPGGVEKLSAARPGDGSLEGSSYEFLKQQLLDRHDVDRAVLAFDVAPLTTALLHPYLTVDIARATNDWTIDRWLGRDERLVSLMLVPNQLPQESA